MVNVTTISDDRISSPGEITDAIVDLFNTHLNTRINAVGVEMNLPYLVVIGDGMNIHYTTNKESDTPGFYVHALAGLIQTIAKQFDVPNNIVVEQVMLKLDNTKSI